MVNGWCFGGAFNSMIACDIAIAAEEATFGLSEINWGIIPAGNVLKNTSSVINRRNLLYYTMTGEPFDGKKAAEMGLVNEAVPLAKLKERVTALANVLLQKNPAALRACKQAASASATCRGTMPRITSSPSSTRCASSIPRRGARRACRNSSTTRSYRPGLGAYKRED